MILNYKIQQSEVFEESLIKSISIDQDHIVETIKSLYIFFSFDAIQQAQIIDTLYSYTIKTQEDISNYSQTVFDISQFISNWIHEPLNIDQTVNNFLHFFTEWTFSHNVQDESYLQDPNIMQFLLYMTLEYQTDNFKIRILSLSILWNIMNDSQLMRNYFSTYLQDESQMKLLVTFISQNCQNYPIVSKIMFQLFGIILKPPNYKSINLGIVFDELIFPLMSDQISTLPSEVISFISLYFYHLENSASKQEIFRNIIEKISFNKFFEYITVYDEERYYCGINFLRSLLDYYNSESLRSFNVFFDFFQVSSCFQNNDCSPKTKKSFCELLISFFQQTSIYNFEEYNFQVIFQTLKSFSADEFDLIQYMLTAYYFIILKLSKFPLFYNCIFSDLDSFGEFLSFILKAFDADSDDMIEKACKILHIIMDILSAGYIDKADDYIFIIRDMFFDEIYEGENIDDLRQTFEQLFSSE